MSSISRQLKSHLRRSCEEELPEVTSMALTGGDVSHVTGSMFCACPDPPRTIFPRFFRFAVLFSYDYCSTSSTVVQVPWLPEVTEGNVTPKEFPWKGVRMQNRKLRNIRPSGAF